MEPEKALLDCIAINLKIVKQDLEAKPIIIPNYNSEEYEQKALTKEIKITLKDYEKAITKLV